MNHTPKILENTIQFLAKRSEFDYAIQFDITGKIYEVKPLVYELPLAAQKLILSKAHPFLERRNREIISAYADLMQLILPLCIVHQLPSMQDVFAAVIDQIDAQIEREDILRFIPEFYFGIS